MNQKSRRERLLEFAAKVRQDCEAHFNKMRADCIKFVNENNDKMRIKQQALDSGWKKLYDEKLALERDKKELLDVCVNVLQNTMAMAKESSEAAIERSNMLKMCMVLMHKAL